MKHYFGYEESDLTNLGAFYTAKEIADQPELWLNMWTSAQNIIPELQKFIKRILRKKDVYIILTGAGTSAFIGEVLAEKLEAETGIYTKAVATTDIVTHPHLYFSKNKPLLLLSFARSGNSPESLQAVKLAEKFADKVYHLIITCNPQSELVANIKSGDNFIFFMPPEADDQSLAMTGSFTTMLLAGLLVAYIDKWHIFEENINLLIQYTKTILTDYAAYLKTVADLNFNRAVFLGSGMMKGIARESHLKLQELTDGKIICKYDSFLGLRHGPKAVIDEQTLIVYLFSNNDYINQYEFDLVNEVKNGRKNLYSIGVMEKNLSPDLNLKIVLSNGSEKINESFLPVVSVLPAQILGFYKSLNLGLKPDSPSDSGMIHRVVQGVRIYPYE
jgi:tagatose-6-phosphate ketose/aldose isomerase